MIEPAAGVPEGRTEQDPDAAFDAQRERLLDTRRPVKPPSRPATATELAEKRLALLTLEHLARPAEPVVVSNQETMTLFLGLFVPEDAWPWARDLLKRAMKRQDTKELRAVLMMALGLLDQAVQESDPQVTPPSGAPAAGGETM